jgi:hypothetical protein
LNALRDRIRDIFDRVVDLQAGPPALQAATTSARQ